MSFTEIKKAVNSNINKPLDRLIAENGSMKAQNIFRKRYRVPDGETLTKVLEVTGSGRVYSVVPTTGEVSSSGDLKVTIDGQIVYHAIVMFAPHPNGGRILHGGLLNPNYITNDRQNPGEVTYCKPLGDGSILSVGTLNRGELKSEQGQNGSGVILSRPILFCKLLTVEWSAERSSNTSMEIEYEIFD